MEYVHFEDMYCFLVSRNEGAEFDRDTALGVEAAFRANGWPCARAVRFDEDGGHVVVLHSVNAEVQFKHEE